MFLILQYLWWSAAGRVSFSTLCQMEIVCLQYFANSKTDRKTGQCNGWLADDDDDRRRRHGNCSYRNNLAISTCKFMGVTAHHIAIKNIQRAMVKARENPQ